jgi:dihydroorotate dehydrogenase
LGNSGRIIWRDAGTRSTQNRVGLKNAGAKAAAAFLASHPLPPIFGVNIAVSPGVSDPALEQAEAVEALQAFVDAGVRPSWFTLNVSCPNTEDDPQGHQTRERTRGLTEALRARVGDTPLWVKVSPALDPSQYAILMRVFADSDVKAVIATNTIGQATPDDPHVSAGVGGGRLHAHAVEAAALLMDERRRHGYTVDVIGCGGIMDAPSYDAFARVGVTVGQYWSALIYEGLFAAAQIALELESR